MADIIIDKDFKSLIPPLSKEEYKQLTDNIVEEGCREPLILWNNTLIDGHNRYEICTENNIEFKTTTKDFDSREDAEVWIITNQFGRRNLQLYDRAVLALKLETIIADKAKENQVANLKQYQEKTVYQNSDERENIENNKSVSMPVKPINTNKELAKIAGVSHDTIAKVKKIQEKATPEQKSRLEHSTASIHEVYREIKKGEKRQERIGKIVEICKGNDSLTESVKQKYAVIYADPPWKYEHSYDSADDIENHYPTMTLEEICNLEVEEIAADDCVLFLWTTPPKLQESMEVIQAWGFNYRTCMCWDKQHIGLGRFVRSQFELLTISIKGSVPLPTEKNRVPALYSEKRTEHSKKPDYFYEVIEKMYPELPRIELFSRRQREGWHAWGNQVNLS